MIAPEHYGLVEMGFTGAVVLGLAIWQLWSVRDAGKGSPKDPGHAEREHRPDQG